MEYTKEFYLQLAKAYNAAHKKSKEEKSKNGNPLAEAFLGVTGGLEPFFEDRGNVGIRNIPEQGEALDQFILDFIVSIGATKLATPLMCSPEELRAISPAPIAPKKSSKRGAASLGGIVADKKAADLRPEYRAILVDEGKLIATDAHKLVVLKSDELAEYDGETLAFDVLMDKLRGNAVQESELVRGGNPLPYKSVITPKTEGAHIEIDALLDWVNGVCATFANIKCSGKYISPHLYGAAIHLDPEKLYPVLKALKDNGAKSVELIHDRAAHPLQAYADNGNMGLVMPLDQSSLSHRPKLIAEMDIPGTKALAEAKLKELQVGETKDVKSPSPGADVSWLKANYADWVEELQLLIDGPVQSRAEKPKILAIDIETYSPADIKKAGAYAYAAHEDFEVLLFAYAFDDEPVQVVDLASGEKLSAEVLLALTDPEIIKAAHNAAFERTCIARMVGQAMPPEQWECTMVRAAMCGYPFGLDAVAKAMKLPQEKMTEGRALIRYFCSPCKPTKTNGERVRNTPSDDVEKWGSFKEYCIQDVVVERAIRERIAHFQMPDMEKELWVLDQRMNDNGVLIDREFVHNAIELDRQCKDRLTEQAADLTDLDNPNSAAQLKAWLSEELGQEVTSLTKEAIKELLEGEHSDEVIKVLQVRQEMAKTSVKKYEAMANAIGVDGRVRGLLQFYGASRTGRWAGRLVQVQNLPQNHIEDLDLARQLVRNGDMDSLDLCYGNVPDTLSQLIRTAFIAGNGGEDFIVADFSAIEARVIAWLACEHWRQEVFATHGKIYEASAAAMFGVPIEEVTKGSSLRQKGKVAELALGYQGGVNAMVAMGALKMGLQEEELQGLVDAWRSANPAIVRLWASVNSASLDAVRNQSVVSIQRGVRFSYQTGALHVTLPSGRDLIYPSAHIGQNRFGRDAVVYSGVVQATKQWGELETYGGKLVENIVQAIARDCLAEAMLRLDKAGYKIVMHIHDEVVVEATEGNSLKEACEIMGRPIKWAPELSLRADGYVTPYYKKD